MTQSEILNSNKISTPCAFIELEKFDLNAKKMADLVRSSQLKIRIATKSIRVPKLIQRALDSDLVYCGLMTFSAQETAFLSDLGFDDMLLAYPTLIESDLLALKRVHESGKKISVVIDDLRHLRALEKALGFQKQKFKVIFELNVNNQLGPLVIGVRRSPLKTAKDLEPLIHEVKKSQSVSLGGLMAYEAHIAGVGDQNPFKPLTNVLLKPLRKSWAQSVAKKRKVVFESVKESLDPDFIFNGGGTGSLSFGIREKNVLTELTAGSGFFDPQLFDYYSNLNLEASAFFATQVVRQPEKNWYTCLGGGFVASGEPGWDRVPHPVDRRLKLSSFEGTGEVQTPIQSPKSIELGDPVIFRHSKAGELMERFNEVLLIEKGKVTSREKTYRGFGECYF